MLKHIHPINEEEKKLQPRALKTKRYITHAAREYINNHSWECLTTNKVAHAAGISIGTLYKHFNNKSEILKQIFLEHYLYEHYFTINMLDNLGQNPTIDEFIFHCLEGKAQLHQKSYKIGELFNEYQNSFGLPDILSESLNNKNSLVTLAFAKNFSHIYDIRGDDPVTLLGDAIDGVLYSHSKKCELQNSENPQELEKKKAELRVLVKNYLELYKIS